jgi:hypothetical protein
MIAASAAAPTICRMPLFISFRALPLRTAPRFLAAGRGIRSAFGR